MTNKNKLCAACEEPLDSCPCVEGIPKMSQEDQEELERRVKLFYGKDFKKPF